MKSRYFLYAVIFIIFLALLEYPPRTPVVATGASPANTGWDGTSRLVSLLKGMGYHVYSVTDWCSVVDSLKTLKHPVILVFISPEEQYNSLEISCIERIVRWSLHRYGGASVLVADEGPYTNSILAALNISAAIDFSRILRSSTGDPYPIALLRIPGFGEYKLVLDYAAPLVTGAGVKVCGHTLPGDIVAAYMISKGFKAYVISDGSIFINELIGLSSRRYDYVGFTKSLFKWLGNPKRYVVLIEAGKYPPPVMSLPKLLERAITNLGFGALSSVIVFLHPLIWFPILHTLIISADAALRNLLVGSVFARLAALSVGTAIAFALVRSAVGVRKLERDEALKPVEEVRILIDTPIRRMVVKGRVRLGKDDLISLYEIVDSVLRKTIGKGLRDPETPSLLARITDLNQGFIEKYVNDLNKLYDKAVKGGWRPIVVSWNMKVKSLIRDTDKILSKAGAALTAGEGVEKVLRRV